MIRISNGDEEVALLVKRPITVHRIAPEYFSDINGKRQLRDMPNVGKVTSLAFEVPSRCMSDDTLEILQRWANGPEKVSLEDTEATTSPRTYRGYIRSVSRSGMEVHTDPT